MKNNIKQLDDPARLLNLKSLIASKASLKNWYTEIYKKYIDCLTKCPEDGLIVELGSGASFIKEFIPSAITTDLIPYNELDLVVDATAMPFENNTVKAIFMMNVLHHIPDAHAFFNEAIRTLKPGGRIFIVDEFPGLFSKFIYKYLHHEPFDQDQKNWQFKSSGPLSGANGAMAWIIFARDLELFKLKYPKLKVLSFKPHSPFRYWLCGGLKKWNLIPIMFFKLMTYIDDALIKISPKMGSFVDIEITKT
jgi:SAM-dependent methyltransferase